MKISVFTYIIVILLICGLWAQSEQNPMSDVIDQAELEKAIRGHLNVLGNDSLQGRATGTPGAHKAANYIVEQLRDIGIVRAPGTDNYYQNIPMHGSKPTTECELKIYHNNDTLKLKYPDDYLLDKTGSQTFIPVPVSMTFVGYGIHAPEYDYSDYTDVDVSGKVVVFLSGEPASEDPQFFNGVRPTIYSYLESKQRIAISRGAVGSIMIIHPRQNPRKQWENFQKEYSFENVSLAYQPMGHFSVILKPDMTEKILNYSNLDTQQINKLDKSARLVSISLQTRISFSGKFLERDFIGYNVIGLIKSHGLFHEKDYVVISAHYDHLGIGKVVDGDSIYNGVMDNALGTAGVIELGRYLYQNRNKLNNSIVLIFFTGEEKGLLGSTYYTDHPVIPLYKTRANINVDGMAAFDDFKSVVGVGSELSTLGELLGSTANQFEMEARPIPQPFLKNESFSRSDQMSFAKAGVPSILIMDGLDYVNYDMEQAFRLWITWQNYVYHTPVDDLNQPINYLAVDRHFRFLYTYIINVINSKDEIKWYEGAPFENARLRSIAEKR